MTTALDIATMPKRQGVRVRVEGELDLATAAEVRQKVADAQEEGWSLIVVDLSGVAFIDSTGVKALIDAQLGCDAAGTRFEVIAPSGAPRRVFDVMGLTDRLNLQD